MNKNAIKHELKGYSLYFLATPNTENPELVKNLRAPIPPPRLPSPPLYSFKNFQRFKGLFFALIISLIIRIQTTVEVAFLVSDKVIFWC